jgi:hypothetical protein
MAKFIVLASQMAYYSIMVEAEDEDTAFELAIESKKGWKVCDKAPKRLQFIQTVNDILTDD